MARCGLSTTAAPRLAVLLVLLIAAAARPQPQLAHPDYTLYHTKEGVFQTVKDIVAGCPAIMRFDEETLAAGNYSTTLSVVTVEPAGLSDSHSDKIRLLLNFGEHGRELISSEIALRLLRLLCDEAQRAPLLEAYGLSPAHLHQLLQRAVFKIVPMENIRGREAVEGGDLCERKNGRGVDPNRNWDVHWGHKERDYDPNEEFPGAGSFSEPEAALMLRAAQALRPHVWASVHSGMSALFMPYDHRPQLPEGEPAAATLSILQEINKRTCGGRCAVGSGGKSVGYLAHGTATDYMYDKLGVPLSMTWEVYGDTRAAFADCFRMFNPLTKKSYEETVESWTAAFFTLLSLLPQHPQVQGELHLPAAPVPADGGDSAGGALGRRGGVGAGNAQQQQEQQQQEQPGGTAARGTAGIDPPSEGSEGTSAGDASSSSSGGGSSGDSASSADKAVEIASALKEHLEQQQQGEEAEGQQTGGQQEAGQQQEAEQQQQQQQEEAGATAGSGGDTPSLGRGRLPVRRGTQRSRSTELLYWLLVVLTGCGAASYLWSKPRVRYQLSKWLGSRRRVRASIPL